MREREYIRKNKFKNVKEKFERKVVFGHIFYSAAASSAGASAADSVAVAPSSFFFLPKASAPKAGFSFSSPRSNFWSGFVVALSPDLKAAALAESESPEDFMILPVPSLTERVSSFMSKSCFIKPYSMPRRFSSDSITHVYRVLHFSIKSSSS